MMKFVNDDELERYLVSFDDGVDDDVDDDMPRVIFGVPVDRIKAAVDLVEGDKPGSFHGTINHMPENEWRLLYLGDWDEG